MRQDYEYIVLGLGGIGSGAAYWLSRQAGREVLGLEQFELGHQRGGSQDHSRIIRLSYNTPTYVKLARQAYQAWAGLEAELGENLIITTGGLDFGPATSAALLADYASSMAAAEVAFEQMDAAAIMRRWPQLQVSDDVSGLYQAESGIAPAAKCNAAHQRLAREHGATLVEKTPITAVRETGGEIEIVAGGTAYRCRKLVITAGAWSNQVLAAFGLHLPLTVTQEQVTYFASPSLADFAPGRFPIWIWHGDPCFYGFPVYGEAGVKVAQDVGGREVTADTRTFEPDPANFARVEQFMRQTMPAALGPVIYTKTCLYTLPPDRDFVIDHLPGRDNCVLAIGAGHAFKFASLIGKILSELVISGKTGSDISPFKADRPILTMADPPRHFLV